MLQGTSSHVGKSVLTAAFCRILKRKGVRVAPFKAQNMALNSAVAIDGGEIGRAQAFQAEAAGLLPVSDMNPILLKPSGDSVSQVIVQGKVFGSMSAVEFHSFKAKARELVLESFNRLSSEYDFIMIEGAGSPAEINLRENDIANMGMAKMASSPVILIGDIDRGGVFASIVGTLELLPQGERDLIKGFLINKFRGDRALLDPALRFIEERTKKPVLGVVPYLKGMMLPDEDSVSLDSTAASKSRKTLGIKVVKLPRISNFTDFDPFKCEPDVEVSYIEDAGELANAAAVILPGSKNTVEDLLWLRKTGLYGAIRAFAKRGGTVVGICGGFQMMGSVVKDPEGVESSRGAVQGLELIEMETVLKKDKKTFQIEAELYSVFSGQAVSGYEIHMGETDSRKNISPFARIIKRNNKGVEVADGFMLNEKVWGTYIHGIFDNDNFRKAFLDRLRSKLGLSAGPLVKYRELAGAALDELASRVEEAIDIEKIFEIAGIDARRV